jgi:hypothetical protein
MITYFIMGKIQPRMPPKIMIDRAQAPAGGAAALKADIDQALNEIAARRLTES